MSKKIVDYIIVEKRESRNLSKRVKLLIKDGYHIFGSPFIRTDNDDDNLIVQAMVKYED